MPALLNAMSTRPCRSATPSNSARTASSSATSHGDELAADLVGGRLAGLGVDVDGDHLGALGGEPARGGQPDAAARAGDDGDPVLQADPAPSHSSVLMKTFLTR